MSPPVLLDCFAVVAPGLEALALAEARALGLPAHAESGGFAWKGDHASVLRANTGLRIASRVIVRIAAFEARAFSELEKHARRIEWHRLVRAGATVRFRVTCRKSKLYHSDAVAQRLADAAMRVVPGVRAEGGSVSEEEWGGGAGDDAQLVIVRLSHDEVTVSADTSGALLHRRGYRQATAKAPLRETLAAGLLSASGWDGASPLVDPLCGSGTIPIEAALAGRRIAPGARRTFAVERWPGVAVGLGDRVRAELAEAELPEAPGAIVGSDRDAGAIESAVANAERAGVEGDIEFAERAIGALSLPAEARGWIVSNPPYGVRVGDSGRVRDLWAQLGRTLRERAPGWHVALLSPDPALERQLGFRVRVAATTSNGGIPIRMITGTVPE